MAATTAGSVVPPFRVGMTIEILLADIAVDCVPRVRIVGHRAHRRPCLYADGQIVEARWAVDETSERRFERPSVVRIAKEAGAAVFDKFADSADARADNRNAGHEGLVNHER